MVQFYLQLGEADGRQAGIIVLSAVKVIRPGRVLAPDHEIVAPQGDDVDRWRFKTPDELDLLIVLRFLNVTFLPLALHM